MSVLCISRLCRFAACLFYINQIDCWYVVSHFSLRRCCVLLIFYFFFFYFSIRICFTETHTMANKFFFHFCWLDVSGGLWHVLIWIFLGRVVCCFVAFFCSLGRLKFYANGHRNSLRRKWRRSINSRNLRAFMSVQMSEHFNFCTREREKYVKKREKEREEMRKKKCFRIS